MCMTCHLYTYTLCKCCPSQHLLSQFVSERLLNERVKVPRPSDQELNPYLLSLEMIANINFSTGMHQVVP
jgi:hypothetical protein